MDDEELLSRIHGLGDLDLAALLCLISREHCIVSTEPSAVDDLVEELQLVASQTFKLKPTTLVCTPQTTLDDFAASILLPLAATPSRSASPLRTRTPGSESYYHTAPTLRALSPLSHLSGANGQTVAPQIANVVLARDLDKAPKAVQIQALELLRTRRIFTRTSVQAAPKQFLFIAVLGAGSGGSARLTEHLNDFFYIAHWHDPLDGFAHLEERDEDGDEAASMKSAESVVRRSATGTPKPGLSFDGFWGNGTGIENGNNHGLFREGDIAKLALESRRVSVDVEVLRYQMNIVSFLRMHRAVAGGVSPVATKHYDQLLRCLASLHGLDFATPALVALAAKKIYMHRIRMTAPEKERSMQWGSDLAAVEHILDRVGPEDVIDDVLGMVSVPL